MRPPTGSRVFRYGLAVGSSAVAVGIAAAFRPLTDQASFVPLLGAVVVSVWWGGLGSGLLATALGALGSPFVLLDPLYSFSVRERQDLVRWALFVVVAILICALGAARSRALRRASIQQAHLELLGAQLDLALEPGDISVWQLDSFRDTLTWPGGPPRLLGDDGDDGPTRLIDFLDRVHPDERVAVADALEAAAREPSSTTIEHRIVRPDGDVRWIRLQGRPLIENGATIGMVGVAVDVSEQHASKARLELKAAALEITETSLSMEERVVRFARLLVPALADFCSVELRGSDGIAEAAAVAAVDPEKEPVLRRLRELYSRTSAQGAGIADALENERPILLREMSAEFLASYAQASGEHEHEVRRALERLAPLSAMAIPLRVGRRPAFGVVTLNMAESGRRYDEADLLFAVELAGSAALAIDNARLFDLERATRIDAERARDRASFLAEAGFVLDTALGLDERLSRLASLAVPRIADWCTVDLVEDGVRRMLAVEAADPAKRQCVLDLQERYPPHRDESYGAPGVIRTGQPQLVDDIPDSMLQEVAQNDEHLTMLRQIGLRSFMCVPLAAHGIIFGALTLVSAESGRVYDADDLAYVQVLAARAGVALDNARLFDRQREIAQTLQQVVLPAELPNIPGLDIFASFRPAEGDVDVGGDFYDVFVLDEHTVIALVGDVCGKGVEAATLTAFARAAVRSTARLEPDPARLLEILNGSVREQRPDDRFITLALARVDLGEHPARITVARAGHQFPLILRSSGAVERIEGGGAPVGVLAELHLEETTMELRAGDALILYTDGLTEARSDHAIFGLDRLEAVLSNCVGERAATIVQKIASSEAVFVKGRPRRDDMVVLAVKITRPAPHT